ncbi:MAG: prepilin peptidase [Ignavibacteriae bacterium]|nr:prepilin peptidase [Ignavibacteriota bacterium]
MSILTLIGLSLGSFINVCVYRLPRGISVVRLSSFCPSCNRDLKWYELIPVLSFVFSKGKCRKCLSAISFQYPLVELFVAALTSVLFLVYGPTQEFLTRLTFLLLAIPIAIIDWKHFIIPNKILLMSYALGIIGIIGMEEEILISSIISSISSFVLMFVIMLAGDWLFKKPSMGFGDVKLAGLIGLFLGFQNFLVAFWFAALLGTAYGLVHHFRLQKINPQFHPPQAGKAIPARRTCSLAGGRNPKLPFGSFLAFSSSIVLIFQTPINNMLESWLTLMQ